MESTTLNGLILKDEKVFKSFCIEMDVCAEGGNAMQAKDRLYEAINNHIDYCKENKVPLMSDFSRGKEILFSRNDEIVSEFDIKLDSNLLKI